MPYIIRWLTENTHAIVPIIVVIYWVLSAIKGAMTPAKPSPTVPRPVVPPLPPADPGAQRLPYQPLAGPNAPTGAAPARPPLADSNVVSVQTFAEEAVSRRQQRFALSTSASQATPPTTRLSQSMELLREESDRRYAATAVTTAANQVVSDATAAAAAANKPGFIELLGGGDSDRGALVASLILSQTLDRRRSGFYRGGSFNRRGT